MAGGIGSRFWPMSTEENPKQFQDILGTGRTMIQQTFDRISKIIPVENIFVITNTEYTELCQQQLPELGDTNIVGEPAMKNTAACNLYMVQKIAALDPDAVICVLPADHLILKEDVFCDKIETACRLAQENPWLITLGIKPTRPDTGYGYIYYKQNEIPWAFQECFKVQSFTEKPDRKTAEAFFASGSYLWNAGIFIWSVRTVLRGFEKYLPEMVQKFSLCTYNGNDEKACIERIYPSLAKISIDNGILEKADNVYVLPAELGWSDLGTWTSVYENATKDNSNNACNTPNLLADKSTGNIIRTPRNKKVVLSGLDNYIVVDTEDALLICPRKHDQKIKEFVEKIKRSKD